jgi:hypothetical protein
MSNSTLGAIQTKVRRVTRSPSSSQITDAQINEYINTFIAYDFPAELKLFSLRTILDFYTQPNVDTYATDTTDPLDPLYNFDNVYTAVHRPIFLAGVPGFLEQDRTQFYSIWPQTNQVSQLAITGNGTPGPYYYNLNTTGAPVLQNNCTFSALDISGTSMILKDYPVSNTQGALGLPGQPQVLPSPYGDINYLTGVFTLVFPNNVATGATIWAETIPYQAAKPIAALYYNKHFVIRPVPDKTYKISIEADIRPTQLLVNTDVPELEQWWQYIALGASIKIFQDRFDYDSVQLVWPEFVRQQDMVARKSIEQYAGERSKSLFTRQKEYNNGWYMGSWPY